MCSSSCWEKVPVRRCGWYCCGWFICAGVRPSRRDAMRCHGLVMRCEAGMRVREWDRDRVCAVGPGRLCSKQSPGPAAERQADGRGSPGAAMATAWSWDARNQTRVMSELRIWQQCNALSQAEGGGRRVEAAGEGCISSRPPSRCQVIAAAALKPRLQIGCLSAVVGLRLLFDPNPMPRNVQPRKVAFFNNPWLEVETGYNSVICDSA